MIDNCYGEFVEEKEPIEVGADIAVGSLMKNLGAGIATSGAYIVGKKRISRTMRRKTNSTRNRKRNRTITKPKHKLTKRTILCTTSSIK